MKLIAELLKPYTEEDRLNFIVGYNHNQGCEMKETGEALQAWGYTDEEKKEQEQERIDMLTMTALDLIKYLVNLGIPIETINKYLEANLELKMELTYCQNVYCGRVKQFMPITIGDITLTAEMVEAMFKAKNNEAKTNE